MLFVSGIGITIRNEAESIVIARVFSDGPASKKGTLRPGMPLWVPDHDSERSGTFLYYSIKLLERKYCFNFVFPQQKMSGTPLATL